eukprot:4556144-Ditylum_brightwellii.AAC.1
MASGLPSQLAATPIAHGVLGTLHILFPLPFHRGALPHFQLMYLHLEVSVSVHRSVQTPQTWS